jgi:hypothetical protein
MGRGLPSPSPSLLMNETLSSDVITGKNAYDTLQAEGRPVSLSALRDVSTTPNDESIRAVYEEVCNSYHAIDEFRMKLLGLLPLTSIIGLVILEKGAMGGVAVSGKNEIVAYASFFAAAFTLALFVYEIRGIRRSHKLVERGQELERLLCVPGQFSLCAEEAQAAKQANKRWRRIALLFNSKTAACVMYALVFTAWLFLALRYGFGWAVHTCGLFALAFGLTLAVAAYRVVRSFIPA